MKKHLLVLACVIAVLACVLGYREWRREQPNSTGAPKETMRPIDAAKDAVLPGTKPDLGTRDSTYVDPSIASSSNLESTIDALLSKMTQSNDPDSFIPELVRLTTRLLQRTGSDRATVERYIRKATNPPMFRGTLAVLLSLTSAPAEEGVLRTLFDEQNPDLDSLVTLSVAISPYESQTQESKGFWEAFFIAMTQRGYIRTSYLEKYDIKPGKELPSSLFWMRLGRVRTTETAVLVNVFERSGSTALKRDMLWYVLDTEDSSILKACLSRIPHESDEKLRMEMERVVGKHLSKPEAQAAYRDWYHAESDATRKAHLLDQLAERLSKADALDLLALEYERNRGGPVAETIVDRLGLLHDPRAEELLVKIATSEATVATRTRAIQKLCESTNSAKDTKEQICRRGLSDQEARVRRASLVGLATIDASGLETELRRIAASDPSDEIRTLAAYYLRRFDQPSDEPRE